MFVSRIIQRSLQFHGQEIVVFKGCQGVGTKICCPCHLIIQVSFSTLYTSLTSVINMIFLFFIYPGLPWKPISLKTFPVPFLGCDNYVPKKTRLCVLSPEIASPSVTLEFLDAWDDEYDGVIINPESLPTSANAFASALQTSLYNWKLKVIMHFMQMH